MRAGRQLGILWGGVASILIALSPLFGRLVGALPGCPIKDLFGIPCPTCGSTRAAVALAELDVLAAVAVSPLATVGWLTLVVGGLVAGLLALLNAPLEEPDWRVSLPVRWLMALVILANWVYLVGTGA